MIKKGKKFVAAFIVCVMTLLSCGSSVFAASALSTAYVDMDFSTLTKGTQITGNFSLGGKSMIFQKGDKHVWDIVEDPKPDKGTQAGNVLYIHDTATTAPTANVNSALVQQGIGASSVINIEFMVPSTNDASERLISWGGQKVVEIKNAQLKILGVKTETSLQANHWYHLTALVTKTGENCVLNVYVDGKFEGTKNFTFGANQIRVDLLSRKEYFGGQLYLRYLKQNAVSGTTKASVSTPNLASVSGPATITFDGPVLASTLTSETIQVLSNAEGVEAPEGYEIVPVTNQKGETVGANITFPTPLVSDGAYKVKLDGVVDVNAVKVVSEGEMSFTTPQPDYIYEFGDIKLYQGFGSARKELTDQKLTEGLLTVEVPVSNAGVQSRDVTLVVAAYEGDTLTNIQYTTYTMGARASVTLAAGWQMTQVTDHTRVDIMMWKTATDAEPLMDKITLTK